MPDEPTSPAKSQPGRGSRPHLQHEERLRESGVQWIAGVDEAGRGPLAGPVVAAAVILPVGFAHSRLNDSKKLSPMRRERIFGELTANPAVIWASAVVEASVIDRINILRATIAAMRQAVATLSQKPDHVLVDGLPVYPFPWPQTAIVEGDTVSLSIAAASVIAKVTRDRLMAELDVRYPGYGFARNKGYPTSQHLAILARNGPCPIHRFTFRPVGQPMLPLFGAVGRPARRTARPPASVGSAG
jgi:ribonuclease HII